jgi:hypothetical protein
MIAATQMSANAAQAHFRLVIVWVPLHSMADWVLALLNAKIPDRLAPIQEIRFGIPAAFGSLPANGLKAARTISP